MLTIIKICITLITMVLFVTGCRITVPKTNSSLELNVMTFNILLGDAKDGKNSWPNRTEQVCQLIHHHAPHLLGVQEAYRFQLDDMNQCLSEYGEIGEGSHGGTENEYNAILYLKDRFDVDESGTFWLSDTPETPSTHWGNKILRICTWARFTDKKSGRSFYMYNTHFDNRSQPSREKSIRLMMQYVVNRKHDDPFILTGDFNVSKKNPVIKYLKGQLKEDNSPIVVADTFRMLHPDATSVGTLHGFKGRTDRRKIDHIFVPPSTKILEAAIIRSNQAGRYPSDHFPVTARFVLKEMAGSN